MNLNTRKIVSLIFIVVGLIISIIYAMLVGVYNMEDDYGICFDTITIIDVLVRGYYPVLGIGLIIFFIPDNKE